MQVIFQENSVKNDGVSASLQVVDQSNLIQNTVNLKGCTTGSCEGPVVVQGQGNTQKNTAGIKQVGDLVGI